MILMDFFKKLFICILVALGIVAHGATSDGEPKCEHDWIERTVAEARISEATCTEPARYYKSCSKCKVISDSLIFDGERALGHIEVCDAVAENLVTAADCENPAVYKKYCSRCDEDLGTFEHGVAIGHDYQDIVNPDYQVYAQTCETAETYHKSCVNCGEAHESEIFVIGKALGHTPVSEIVLVDGKEVNLKLAQGCENAATYYEYCTRCGTNMPETFTVGEALGHNIIEKVSIGFACTRADCENAATYYKSCEHCGMKSTETFVHGEPLGHNFVEREELKYRVEGDYTCGDTPSYYIACSVCEAHKGEDETFVGSPLEHKFIVIEAVAVTETQHGAPAHQYCTVCDILNDMEGNVITEVEVIHNYVWCDSEDHTKHYKACSVEGCDAPHLKEGEHTFDEEGCDVTCNGGCGYERESQHVDENKDGICDACGGEVHSPAPAPDEDLENLTPWMPL